MVILYGVMYLYAQRIIREEIKKCPEIQKKH